MKIVGPVTVPPVKVYVLVEPVTTLPLESNPKLIKGVPPPIVFILNAFTYVVLSVVPVIPSPNTTVPLPLAVEPEP